MILSRRWFHISFQSVCCCWKLIASKLWSCLWIQPSSFVQVTWLGLLDSEHSLVSRCRKFHVLFYRQILVCIEIQATFITVDIFSARFIQFLMLWRVRNHAQHCSFTRLSLNSLLVANPKCRKAPVSSVFHTIFCGQVKQSLLCFAHTEIVLCGLSGAVEKSFWDWFWHLGASNYDALEPLQTSYEVQRDKESVSTCRRWNHTRSTVTSCKLWSNSVMHPADQISRPVNWKPLSHTSCRSNLQSCR
jgi:hypothetical protein